MITDLELKEIAETAEATVQQIYHRFQTWEKAQELLTRMLAYHLASYFHKCPIAVDPAAFISATNQDIENMTKTYVAACHGNTIH